MQKPKLRKQIHTSTRTQYEGAGPQSGVLSRGTRAAPGAPPHLETGRPGDKGRETQAALVGRSPVPQPPASAGWQRGRGGPLLGHSRAPLHSWALPLPATTCKSQEEAPGGTAAPPAPRGSPTRHNGAGSARAGPLGKGSGREKRGAGARPSKKQDWTSKEKCDASS